MTLPKETTGIGLEMMAEKTNTLASAVVVEKNAGEVKEVTGLQATATNMVTGHAAGKGTIECQRGLKIRLPTRASLQQQWLQRLQSSGLLLKLALLVVHTSPLSGFFR